MSEVIEEYIRRHPGLREGEAFDTFVEQEKIRSWIGQHADRRERLRSEFGRVWQHLQGAAGGTRGPVSMRETDVEIAERAKQQRAKRLQVEMTPDAPAARLPLMCPTCRRLDVWRAGDAVACRNCGRTFDDMLDLVPVHPVGPFEFVFGSGARGVAVAAGILVLLITLYGVLRWR